MGVLEERVIFLLLPDLSCWNCGFQPLFPPLFPFQPGAGRFEACRKGSSCRAGSAVGPGRQRKGSFLLSHSAEFPFHAFLLTHSPLVPADVGSTRGLGRGGC